MSGAGILWIIIRRQRRVEMDHQLSLGPVYEEPGLLESAIPQRRTAASLTMSEASESHVEMEINAAYGHIPRQV